MMQREMIIQKLKESGCRITKQRLMLLDIILEEDCSCCKEIYFKASKVDPKNRRCNRLPHGKRNGGYRSH